MFCLCTAMPPKSEVKITSPSPITAKKKQKKKKKTTKAGGLRWREISCADCSNGHYSFYTASKAPILCHDCLTKREENDGKKPAETPESKAAKLAQKEASKLVGWECPNHHPGHIRGKMQHYLPAYVTSEQHCSVCTSTMYRIHD
jgi:ribosomal protein S27E